MKRFAAFFLVALTLLPALGQRRTTMATQWRQFRPSEILLKDCRVLKEPLTNIFLKNSSLLYMSGDVAKEANMDIIAGVRFDDRQYVTIGRQLGWYVGTGGRLPLYCIELFDMESYERNLRNNNTITNLDLGFDQVTTTTVDLNGEEDWKFPVFRHYYMRYDGKYVRMHERDIQKVIPKERRHAFKSVVARDDFSWSSPERLLELLAAISEK